MSKRISKIRTGLTDFQQIPNVGPATAGDFRVLGIDQPADLAGRDPYGLYDDLCQITGQRHDLCMLDVFIAAVRYMEGGPSTPWWKFTPERKRVLAERK